MQGRIIGIGIGEDIQIAWRHIGPKGEILTAPAGLTLRSAMLNDRAAATDAHERLRQALLKLKTSDEYGHLFDDAVGVAFSAIGHVDRERRQLLDAVRKNWKVDRRNGSDTCAIDFTLLKDEFFPEIEKPHFLANNDAPCAALAEQELDSKESSVFFITINDGINVGVVHQGFELDKEDHPSFGHAYPRPHAADFEFSLASACPHGTCFDALASGTRIRETWGKELTELPDDHEAWDIIAYYIAQLCVAGRTMFTPNRIILGGSVMWGSDEAGPDAPRPVKIGKLLMPRIWQHYTDLRGGAYPTRRVAVPDPAERLRQARVLIQRGSIYRLANGRGALALARVPHLSAQLTGVQ